MMRLVLVSMLLLAAGIAAVPAASADCADGHAVDCVREARDFILRQECFNGPLWDPIDHFCWA